MKLGLGAKIQHPKFGEGVVFGYDEDIYRIYFKNEGEKEIAKEFEGMEILEEPVVVDKSISLIDVIDAVQNVFDQYYDVTGIVELGDKWEGGNMILQPADKSLKGKEIPIETFFHKIVMVRDRIRVMEQQINANAKLNDEDKVNLQQYITRIYGSLTTFNVLFKSKNDYFVGESSKNDD
jgi:hypothetical protein